MAKKISILVGSLRRASFARKVALNAVQMFPEGYQAEIVEIGHLPLYNFDYDDPAVEDVQLPESYTDFRETIKASDGILHWRFTCSLALESAMRLRCRL